MKREGVPSGSGFIESPLVRQFTRPNFQGKASLTITVLGMALLFVLSSYELKTMASFPDLYEAQTDIEPEKPGASFMVKGFPISPKAEISKVENHTGTTVNAGNPPTECEPSLSSKKEEGGQEDLFVLWKREDLRW